MLYLLTAAVVIFWLPETLKAKLATSAHTHTHTYTLMPPCPAELADQKTAEALKAHGQVKKTQTATPNILE